jgi:hypothetical protein
MECWEEDADGDRFILISGPEIVLSESLLSLLLGFRAKWGRLEVLGAEHAQVNGSLNK